MYEKPSMKVVPLRRKPQLLVGSYTNALNDPEDYSQEDDPFDF